MDKADNSSPNGYHTQSHQDHNFGLRNTIVLIVCLSSSILISHLINNPFGSYIPLILLATIAWYRSYTRETRSYYGLCRLILYLFIISLWVVFILRIFIQSIAFLLGYGHLQIEKVQYLFPYALMFTTFARNKQDMHLNDIRRYIIHFLYDLPAFFLVIIFKLLNDPLNSLYSEITTYCYLGCLPIASDVDQLNKIGIKYVVNMCAEYNGPLKTYTKYNIKQLYLPTVDMTSPSLKDIEKAIQFMNEAYTNKEKIFVHCKSGMGRSAAIVLCHLVANENMSIEDAFKLLKQKRPEITSAIIHYRSLNLFLASLKNDKSQ
jgi:atypical dual specificity phosphatase